MISVERSFFDKFARNPVAIRAEIDEAASRAWQGRDVEEGLAALCGELERHGASLPVLYRQYVDLCEPQGVRFLGFGTDPSFGHCVDGLIRLDLNALKATKRRRYLPLRDAGVKGLADVGKLS